MQKSKYLILIYLFFSSILSLGYFTNISFAAKVPIEVDEECQGSLTGQRLVFLVRENLRQSATFRLTYITEPKLFILINTIDVTTNGDIIAYSYMICTVKKPFLNNHILKGAFLGRTNRNRISDNAMEIVATLEKIANESMKSIGNMME